MSRQVQHAPTSQARAGLGRLGARASESDPLDRELRDPLTLRAPVLHLPQGGGSPLPKRVREEMETAFHADFASVRVRETLGLVRAGARAAASGDTIHFAPGRFQPATAAGRRLIGHELTHVLQQRRGLARAAEPGAINLDPALEAQADRLGARVAAGESVPQLSSAMQASPGGAVQGDWESVKRFFSRRRGDQNDNVPPPQEDAAQPEPDNRPYTHLDVSTPVLKQKTDDSGELDEETQQEFETTKRHLKAKYKAKNKAAPTEQDVRYKMLKTRIKAAETNRQQSEAALRAGPNADPNARVMGLFVAPEWSLGKNLTKEQMERYDQRFQKLSRKNPEMLIAPGSGVWQERQGQGAQQTRLMHNTANAYFGGQNVHQVHKHAHAGDSEHTRDAYRGGRPVDAVTARQWWDNAPEHPDDAPEGSSFFEAGGRRFALDICADHASRSRARNELVGAEHPQGADVHIVESAGAAIADNKLAVKAGGLAVQNDATGAFAKVGTARQDGPQWRVQRDHTGNRLVKGTPAVPLPADYEGFHRGEVEFQDEHKRYARPDTDEQRALKAAHGTIQHMGTFELPDP